MSSLLTPVQAAELLAVTPKHLLELTNEGALRWVNIGLEGKRPIRRYKQEDLAEFIEKRSQKACRYTENTANQNTPMTSSFAVVDFPAPRARDKRQAERILEQKRQEALDKLKTAASFTAEGPMTLEIAASRYWLEVGQHLANSVNYYRFIGWILDHFGKHITLDQITDSMIAAMVSRRRGDGVSNATVNRTAAVPLRGIMTRAKKTWKVPVGDIDWSRHLLKEPKERVREASQDEERRLLNAMRDDYAPAVSFALLTGCRRMEIVDLTWSRVDFFGRTITVTGKGDKTRILPMTEAVHALLWVLKGHHATSVFTYVARRTNKRRKLVRGARYPITMEGFKTAWRRYRDKSGVENFRFHDTRHTAATRTLRTGNMKIVQRMLGHEDIATTAKYAHAMVEDMRVAMEAANHTGSHTGAGEGASTDLKDKKKSA